MNKTIEEVNEFDEIEKSLNPDEQPVDKVAKTKAEREKVLIYNIFAKTKEGQELLRLWVENNIILSPVFEYGSDQSMLDVGFMQGCQHVARSIFMTVKNYKEDE